MKLVTAVLVIPLLATAPAGPGVARQPASQQPAAYVYNGTVHVVRTESSTMDVITGVGLSLRMVHMNVLPTTAIEADGRRIALSDLKPGDVVHAECRLTPDGMVADRIQRVTAQTPAEKGGE